MNKSWTTAPNNGLFSFKIVLSRPKGCICGAAWVVVRLGWWIFLSRCPPTKCANTFTIYETGARRAQQATKVNQTRYRKSPISSIMKRMWFVLMIFFVSNVSDAMIFGWRFTMLFKKASPCLPHQISHQMACIKMVFTVTVFYLPLPKLKKLYGYEHWQWHRLPSARIAASRTFTCRRWPKKHPLACQPLYRAKQQPTLYKTPFISTVVISPSKVAPKTPCTLIFGRYVCSRAQLATLLKSPMSLARCWWMMCPYSTILSLTRQGALFTSSMSFDRRVKLLVRAEQPIFKLYDGQNWRLKLSVRVHGC